MAPRITVEVTPMPGCKRCKERFWVLECANEHGSEKIELMIIGTALRSKTFKKKSRLELGIDYDANRNA